MIKFRMTGERHAIHELAVQVRSSFPDQPITVQDANDRLSAKIDLSLPVRDAQSLFGAGSPGTQTAGRLHDRSPSGHQLTTPRFLVDWRASLAAQSGSST